MIEIKPIINYEEFSKIDIRVGTILSAEKIEKSEKLLRMEVDFGFLGKRQILAGISQWYDPKELIGKQTTFVLNLQPRTMMGLESQGMLFAIGLEEGSKPVLIQMSKEVENGDGAR